MFHIPIVDTDEEKRKIEFCHIINNDANENTWRNNKNISLDCIKINAFVRGAFSVVVENEYFTPVYGDFCVLSPHRVHYGRITKQTALEYYQLDIGVEAFNGIPGGRELLFELAELSQTEAVFVRPEQADGKALLGIFEKIKSAICIKNFALAFAYTIEAASKMKSLYGENKNDVPNFLSRYVSSAISYIEDNYSHPITIDEISAFCKVSSSYLSRRFKMEIGASVHDYITNLRVSKAAELLNKMSVAETAVATGFCDSSHFIAVFRKMFGITPTKYLRMKG